jgi:SAM-dependent methyltransferase
MIFKNYVWDNSDFTNAHSYLIDNILSNLPDKNSLILDFGCGNGAISNYLISKGYNVYGIDPSENGISIAKKKIPEDFTNLIYKNIIYQLSYKTLILILLFQPKLLSMFIILEIIYFFVKKFL